MSVRDRRAGPRAVVLEDAHGPGAAPRGQRVEAVARERDELARGGWREVGEALVVAPRRDEHFHRAARRAVARAARREAVAAPRAARRSPAPVAPSSAWKMGNAFSNARAVHAPSVVTVARSALQSFSLPGQNGHRASTAGRARVAHRLPPRVACE